MLFLNDICQVVCLDMFVNGLAVICRSGWFHRASCLSRGRTHVLAFLHLLRCRLQKRPHLLKKKRKKKKKKKKSLSTLPNFFGVVTLNTHIFLFGSTKYAKHFEKMAVLIYAELTQGRESTRLPHTHKYTSLKNVVISALHKIDKRIHIQA